MLVDSPEYEFIGDWDKILGKVEEKKSEKGGKYYIATYTKADEAGLGVICRLRLKGESEPRVMKVMMSQCYPRFSTQWATDPKLQICYVAIRKWSRLHKPGVILGVYTPEELSPSNEMHMGPADVVGDKPAPEPSYYPQADFDKNLEAWTKVVASGRKTLEGMYAFVESKAKLSDEQKKTLAVSVKQLQENTIDATPKSEQQPEQHSDAPQVDPQKLAADMKAAKSVDELYEKASLIDALTDKAQRQSLEETFEAKKAELDPQ